VAGAPSVGVATATELALEMPPATASGTGTVRAATKPADPGLLPFEAPSASPGAEALAREIAAYEAAVGVEDATAATGSLDSPVSPGGAKSAGSHVRRDAGVPPGKETPAYDRAAAARERGQRFGTLVHAVLAAVDLDAEAAAVRAAAALYARLLGAQAFEVDEAARVASRALAHPLLRRAARAGRAGSCRREVAITATLPDGRLMEGVADMAFLDEGTWTVVDFKTDADLAPGLPGYRRQVALYAWAIARATGKPARGVLLKV